MASSVSAWLCVYVHVRMRARMHVCAYVCMYLRVYVCMRVVTFVDAATSAGRLSSLWWAIPRSPASPSLVIAFEALLLDHGVFLFF